MESKPLSLQSPSVGILVLNYHQPETTLACIHRLLEVEGAGSRVIWLENDADATKGSALELLSRSGVSWLQIDPDRDSLPPAGQVGFISIRSNLGYAGGNNIGLRYINRNNIEFAWILNNDTLLENGSSLDLVRAARLRPKIGLWGATILSPEGKVYSGATLNRKDFSTNLIHGAEMMEHDPLAYVSGCSMFFPLRLGAEVGFVPEDYFLYYEDPAFSMEIRHRGFGLSVVPEVVIRHEESLSTGHRSALMEYYSRRNRWAFIQRYFPADLKSQQRRVWYRFQSLLFRGAIRRAWVEWLALLDWKAGKMNRTNRMLTGTKKT